MKKIIMVMMSFLLLMGCTSTPQNDATRFKIEYESLNGKENKAGRDYVEMEIPVDNPMVYADIDELLDVIQSDGIIYFGFEECPWCRNALPILIESAKEKKVEKIYYYNIKEIRDKLVLDEEGKVQVEKEKSDDYQKIYEALYEDLSVYEGLNDDSIKRLYAPTVVFIKNGKVVKMHEGTVESQVDSNIPMNDKEMKELKEIYLDGMTQVQKTVCEANTKC